MKIENAKIANFWPGKSLWERWDPALVRGVSLLYDTPGCSFGEKHGCPILSCDLTDPRLSLLLGLEALVEPLQSALARLDPCWLRPRSYHCTFANSVNQFNWDKISLEYRERHPEIEAFFRSLPGSASGALPKIFPPRCVATDSPWSIRFRFQKLHVWPGSFALVALLEADDEPSALALKMLSRKRPEVNANLVDQGLPSESGPKPHISLAYFTTEAQEKGARVRADECTELISRDLAGLTVEYHSISLYGWTSMEDFWLCRPLAGLITTDNRTWSL